MRFYLSSFRIGNVGEKLKNMFSENKTIGYIPNALDSKRNDLSWLENHMESDMNELRAIGLTPQLLDLREYFGKKDDLRRKIDELGGVWISGGNVFILRQAMKLSGFDELMKVLVGRDDFVYGGYSAAGCVLSAKLDAYQIVDDITDMPYEDIQETLWDGLGLIDYVFLPHFDSDHSESSDINKEIEYCIENKIVYRALRDGEVIVVE